MSARPLTWWPRSALDAAARTFDDPWRDWCRSWGLSAAAVHVANACEAEPAHRSADWTSCAPAAGVSIGVIGATVPDFLLPMLFASSRNEPHANDLAQPLARAVADAAWRDLQQTIADRVSAGAAAFVSPTPADCWRAWSGAMLIRLGFEAISELEILLLLAGDAARERFVALESSVIPSAAPAAPLVPMLEALDAKRLPVRVALDDTLLDLGSLQSLAIGDVIALGHRLDDRLHVRLADPASDRPARDLCSALLGRRDGRRAVELIPADTSA